MAAATGARLLSLTEVICPDGVCPLVFGTTPVYRDDQHLTATFARSLAPVIDAWIDRLDSGLPGGGDPVWIRAELERARAALDADVPA